MAITGNQFRWIHNSTAWEQMQAWRERRAAMRDDFESLNSALSTSLANAQTDFSTGMASLAVEAFMARAKQASAIAQSQLDLLV